MSVLSSSNFPLVKFGLKNCPASGYDLATVKMMVRVHLPGSLSTIILLSQVMKCMVIIFVEDVRVRHVCQYVRRKKLNIISASGITGVASHGKHTRATEHVCLPWLCYPKECWFVSITWLMIDEESCDCYFSSKGDDALFQSKAERGDPDYKAFWDRVLQNRDKHVYNSVEEGLQWIKNERAVMPVSSGMLKGFFRENPFYYQQLLIFGQGRPKFNALIFTKNSPIVSRVWFWNENVERNRRQKRGKIAVPYPTAATW